MLSVTTFTTLALVALASALPSRRQAGNIVFSCSVPNTAAITFDDGPFQWTREIVDVLDSKNAKGTFFVNGNNFGCIYGESQAGDIKYAFDKGHQLASHTWGHRNLAQLSREEIASEMSGVDDALQKIIGASPTMMRPPFGSVNDLVLQVAAELDETVVIWDFDSGDSAGVPGYQSNAMYDGLVAGHPGSILTLNHETYESTVREVLPHAIDALQGAGYRLVTVAECLGAQPYTNVRRPEPRDDSWRC